MTRGAQAIETTAVPSRAGSDPGYRDGGHHTRLTGAIILSGTHRRYRCATLAAYYS
jgi:hypothetical protein